jgi:lipopolysaccharide biosynthesis regulator YciM
MIRVIPRERVMRLSLFSQTALIVLAMVIACPAQRAALDARQVVLRLMITIDNDSTKAANVTVELMDAVGMGSAMDQKVTDNDGRVEFRTLSGVHRIRITGSEVKPYDDSFEISRSESVHVERIRLHSVSGQPPRPPPGAGAMIPAVRLRIPAAARKSYEKGMEAMNRQRWQESREFFLTAIREYPQYDMAYNGLGAVQMQTNDVEAARQSFARALELNPDFAGANRNLARIFMSEHKSNLALPLLRRSLATEPENVWALANAANSEFLLKDYDSAILDAHKAHTLPHEAFAIVHIVAARALEAKQKPDEAVAEYRLYLSEEPNGPNAARAKEAIGRLTSSAQN